MPIPPKRFNCLVAPNHSALWVFVPLSYTLIIQTLTGFPKPETLKEISAHDFLLYISEELFNYPFWLQDLSHFPLFFVFAWLWTWFLRRKDYRYGNLVKSLLICISFAILNEFSQFYSSPFPFYSRCNNELGRSTIQHTHSYLFLEAKKSEIK